MSDAADLQLNESDCEVHTGLDLLLMIALDSV